MTVPAVSAPTMYRCRNANSTTTGATADDAYEACLALMRSEQPPTALFTLNNQCTVGVARALRSLGAGREVALVGFDDFETADLMDPPVTVVSQDIWEIGRTAAQLMFDRMAGAIAPPQRTVLPTRLIPRGSGELPPRTGRG